LSNQPKQGVDSDWYADLRAAAIDVMLSAGIAPAVVLDTVALAREVDDVLMRLSPNVINTGCLQITRAGLAAASLMTRRIALRSRIGPALSPAPTHPGSEPVNTQAKVKAGRKKATSDKPAHRPTAYAWLTQYANARCESDGIVSRINDEGVASVLREERGNARAEGFRISKRGMLWGMLCVLRGMSTKRLPWEFGDDIEEREEAVSDHDPDWLAWSKQISRAYQAVNKAYRRAKRLKEATSDR
jgi:hypothetical protein